MLSEEDDDDDVVGVWWDSGEEVVQSVASEGRRSHGHMVRSPPCPSRPRHSNSPRYRLRRRRPTPRRRSSRRTEGWSRRL